MTSTTHKGVKGTLLTGPNGNSIFLPFAGYRWDVNLMGIGEFATFYYVLTFFSHIFAAQYNHIKL